MDKKHLRNDLILILSLLVVAIVSLIIVLSTSVKNNLVAKIYYQNEIVETVDLSDTSEREYLVEGAHGYVKIHVKDGAIAVVESNCPHQDCVHMGYVKESNHPIICAYNGVYIVIEGAPSNYDSEIG